MNHVLLEFLHSKQTEEDAIMKADEMVTEAEKKEEGRACRLHLSCGDLAVILVVCI